MQPHRAAGGFMTYIDKRGWLFRVMQGLGESNFKTRYCKKEWNGKKWKCLTVLPWRKTAEEAEDDLAEYAKNQGMEVVEDAPV